MVAVIRMVCDRNRQEMSSDMTLIANGNVRDVYWAEYLGKKVAVKVLRHPDHHRAQRGRLEMHKREILTLDTVRAVFVFRQLTECPTNSEVVHVHVHDIVYYGDVVMKRAGTALLFTTYLRVLRSSV